MPAVAAAGGMVSAVAGRDLARASEYAAEVGIGRAVQGYQTLIDDPDLDALYIPLPNALHAEWTIKALRAGKAVLCEKPLCGTLAETEQVLAVARESGTPLWEAFVFPFHQQMAKIRGLLADGAIGDLREIQSNFHFVLDRQDDIRLRRGMDGGALNDVGCYPVRLAVELFTGDLESARATAVLGGYGVDVDLQGSVGYSGHQRLTVSCSFLRSDDRFARLLGTAGQIHITDPFHPGPDDSFTLFEAGKEARATRPPTRCHRSPPRSGTSSRSSGARRSHGTSRWTTRSPPPGPWTRSAKPRHGTRWAAASRTGRRRTERGPPPEPGPAERGPGQPGPGRPRGRTGIPAGPRGPTGMTGEIPGGLAADAAAAIRAALDAERLDTLDRIAALSREFDGIVESSAGVATDDEHDPEGATIAFERAQLAALIDQARGHLAELDDALDRLRQGSYGRCERCGQPIAAGRLAARPAARTCITCAAAC